MIVKSGIDHVKELGRQNVKDLITMIEVHALQRSRSFANIYPHSVEREEQVREGHIRSCSTPLINFVISIRFMRISSDMFPFAFHPTHGYDLSFAAEELKAAGDLAKKYGHRLTAHPGQHTQLASPKETVVDQSIKELECTSWLLDPF